MHITETPHPKTKTTVTSRRAKTGPAPERPPVWRPESSSLTRAELRQIVLDTLG